MQGWNLFQAAVDGLAEFGEGVVVSTVEHVTFDEFPEPFDQIQIRGVRWQELELDIECRCQILHQSTVLITSIIQYQSNRSPQSECCDFMQQFTHRRRGHGTSSCHADKLILRSVPCPENAVSHAPRSASNESATHAPQTPQKRSLDKMSRIHKEDVAFARTSRSQAWFQFRVEEFLLSRDVFFNRFLWRQRNRRRASPFQAETFFKNFRVWVSPRLMPVASSIRRLASAVVCGGSARNISSKEV